MNKILQFIGAAVVTAIVLLSIVYCTTGEVSIGKFMLQKQGQVKLDQTYVISLDRTPERYSSIDKALTNHDFSHIRFSAADGLKLLIKDETGAVFTGADLKTKTVVLQPNKKYTISCPSMDIEYLYNPSDFRSLSAGEFGCYCSHMEIWKDIAEKNYKAALILEDDAKLSASFSHQMKYLLNRMPGSNWDITYLFVWEYPYNPKYTILNNQALYKYGTNLEHIWCTVAYIISKDGATKLLANLKTFTKPLDHMIDNLISKGGISAYVTTGLYVDQDYDLGSTLNQDGR
jgi:glycosyl transferase family 25